jgi:hypothetical protein
MDILHIVPSLLTDAGLLQKRRQLMEAFYCAPGETSNVVPTRAVGA